MRALVAYMAARYLNERHDRLYREYVTDALKLIAENTAKGRGGRYPSKRYAELVASPKKAAADMRSGDEIAADIIGKLARR